MSLLSVTVKKARYVGPQAAQNDSYVTLKLQNVKSTTVTVKGANPCWEQDFLFETNDVNTGLLIEVWSKGMIWDRALGYHFLPLPSVHYSSEEGPGEWVSLDAELVMMGGEVIATKNPTGHSLLVDCRFELPFDAESTEAADLQRKLEYLNSIVDQEQRAEQARRQMQYFGHSGYSEDSDYTSDLNYPVGQHANSSASQFRNTAHQMSTPQRSLETSRENSYETDEPPSQPPPVQHGHHLAPGPQHPTRRKTQRVEDMYNTYTGDGSTRNYHDHEDPLSYNSRPRNYKETSRRRKNTWNYDDSMDGTTVNCYGWYDDGYTENYETSTDPRIYPAQYNAPVSRATPNKRNKGPNTNRRPSLERQTTLYDDPYNTYEEKYYDADSYPQTDSTSYNRGPNYNQGYYKTDYGYQDDSRYGQEEEDRQWDSGGGGKGQNYYYSSYYRQNRYENKINRSRTKRSSSNRELTREFSESMDDDIYYSTHQSYEDENYQVKNDYSGSTARRKQFNHSRSQSMSQQINDDYDPDFPPPRSRNKPKKLPQIPVKIKPSPSLPPTPVKTQHKPAKRTGSLEYQETQEETTYYQETRNKQIDYNEDYNYAYQSTDNLIHTQPEVIMPSNQYKETVNDVRGTGRGVNQQVYQETNQQGYQQTNQQMYQGTNQQGYEIDNQQAYPTSQENYQTGNQQNYQTINQQNYHTANQQNYQTANQKNYQTTNQQNYQTVNQQGYQTQSQTDYQDDSAYNYYGEKPPTVQVQRPEEDQQTLSRRDTLKKQLQGRQRRESPRIFQQNTDSLESKDDDLRDSFETAMSSVSQQGQHSFNSEYPSVPEQNTMTDKLDRYHNVTVQEKGYGNSIMDNKNDRYKTPVHENDMYPMSVQEKDRLNDSVHENHGLTEEMIDERYNNVQEKNDRYSNSVLDKTERYGSNSHISEREDHELYNSGPGVIGPAIPDRNSSRNNSLQLREQVLSQKTSPVATPTSSYPSQNHNQKYLQRQQESLDSYIEEEMFNESNDYNRDSPVSVVDRYPPESNSLIEPYRATTPKPSSPSPPKRQETLDEEYDPSYEQSFDQQQEDYTIEEMPQPEQKSSFEEQEIVTGDQPKRKMTSKERWHWAYNKIIHQLNVSTHILYSQKSKWLLR